MIAEELRALGELINSDDPGSWLAILLVVGIFYYLMKSPATTTISNQLDKKDDQDG